MASASSWLNNKTLLTAIGVCGLFLLSGYLTLSPSSINTDPSPSPSTDQQTTLTTAKVATTKREFLYKHNTTFNCKINQLHTLSVSKRTDGTYSIRLTNTPKSTTCPQVTLQEIDLSYPRTWLLSFPGSGNTWMRHLLQQLTGVPTGSVYTDGSLMTNGFPYENVTENVVAIKAHNFYAIWKRQRIEVDEDKDRVMLLIRNPYSALLADYKRGQLRLKHTGNAYVDNQDEKWSQYLDEKVPKWALLLRHVINLKAERILIFYEDLGSELLRQLIRIANFIRAPSLQEFAFCCTLHQSEGRHHRPPSNQTDEDVYTKDNRIIINSMLTDLAVEARKDHPKLARQLLKYLMPIL